MKKATLLLAGLFAAISVNAEQNTYEIDPNHSGVTFAVRHFVNDVNGSFGKFSGTVTVDTEDPTKNTAKATINTASVNTNNDKRDGHLLKDDYFNVSKFPEMTFETINWEKTDDEDKYEVTGNLTLLGVTKPVTLEVEYLGAMKGTGHYEGMEIIGFKGEGKIKRSEWGLDSGGPIVGDDVEIEISVQGHRKL
ncbi:YceI family protein [Cerasicoccus fimbriatus]|uniref:YceI family protein n=1 Tax=Cerasicoccus fimbriatus TaxID=3014554 RepID=UPI0022B4BDE4|nr:YceI family protein [Cerasicoccus sp. TK19100]